ncbi:MAG: transglutaminase family protein [Acidobacteriota bacterium]
MSDALYRIEHETRYVHASGVSTSQHVAYLTPRTLPGQSVRWHGLAIEPAPASRARRVDYFGNAVDQFTILTPYDEMCVVGRSLVAVHATEPTLALDAGVPWEAVRDELLYHRGAPYDDAAEFSYPSPYIVTAPALAEYARKSFAPGRPLVAAAIDLMHRIYSEFTFDSGATTVATPVTLVLANRRGVCQDFAHLQIGCLRAIGLAARYVSGYLLTDPPPGQPRLVGADASHAWLSVWCPKVGWVDLDPTNDVLPSHRHITLAWGRDYGDVSPLRGVVLGGRAHTLHVGVSVTPATEDELRLTAMTDQS